MNQLVYFLPCFILLAHLSHHRASATPLFTSTGSFERERNFGVVAINPPRASRALQRQSGFSKPASTESERNFGEIAIEPDSGSPRHAPVDDDSYWQLSDEQGGVSAGKSGMLSKLRHVFNKYDGYERLSEEQKLNAFLDSIYGEKEFFLTGGRIRGYNGAKEFEARALKTHLAEKLLQDFTDLVRQNVASYDVKKKPWIEEQLEEFHATRVDQLSLAHELALWKEHTEPFRALFKLRRTDQTVTLKHKMKMSLFDVVKAITSLTGNDTEELAKVAIYAKAIADVILHKAGIDTDLIKQLKDSNRVDFQALWPMLGTMPKSDEAKLFLNALASLCSIPKDLHLRLQLYS
ncbi:hypothetical protein PtA15_6A447 [Puccinia triticina]|uniref:RxLR effector candidate protein n=1 Tax=Puccinia triticina TaxID=208348 RepID=A0ABY7CLK6_9BASI|nr:uncharacterized protein PtA15_6A447 [Puccinia triticina]WAQ85818.1 hypothetical protein PtA15_6A447 [Puccinia triticina]WAR55706.1 hypothetical protein PtB15_6B449 [Puccinia triticina]